MKLIYNPLIKKSIQYITTLTSELINDSSFAVLPSLVGQALKYAQVKADETGFQYATPTAALPDLVLTRNDTNGNQTIPTGYSAIIPEMYEIGATDILDIQGTGILEVT